MGCEYRCYRKQYKKRKQNHIIAKDDALYTVSDQTILKWNPVGALTKITCSWKCNLWFTSHHESFVSYLSIVETSLIILIDLKSLIDRESHWSTILFYFRADYTQPLYSVSPCLVSFYLLLGVLWPAACQIWISLICPSFGHN